MQPALIDAHFRKAWMPFFFRTEGQDRSQQRRFQILLVLTWSKLGELELPVLTGEDLHAAALASMRLLVVWMAGVGMSSRPSLILFCRAGLGSSSSWAGGLLDAYINHDPLRLMVFLPPLVRGPCMSFL